MALPTPKLDDRTFQQIVNEARQLIPRYCPEWTDHNLSDPGITLIELFAWMMEMLLYRLNRVPEKNLLTFLDLIGVELLPPAAALADLTFTLTAPRAEPIVIPAGTEVATVRTATQQAIVFSTDRNLRIEQPTAIYFFNTPDGTAFQDLSDSLIRAGPLLPIFAEKPKPGNAFYLGLQQDMAGHAVVITFGCTIEGIGVDPTRPPLIWECWDDQAGAWVPVDLEKDQTGGLNRRGDVTLHLPYTLGAVEVNGKRAYWIRCQVIEPQPEQPTYTTSPKIRVLGCYAIGGTVPATHATVVPLEELGRSNGSPGQSFTVAQPPMLPLGEGEHLEVEVAGGWEEWDVVPDFSGSGPAARHFTCDGSVGEISFGPAIRQPDGTTRQFGAIPPKGARMRLSQYRTGGGTLGNVGPRTLTVLKTSIPFVAGVVNRDGAFGGRDAETLEHVKMRAPRQLRTRDRAVTAEDFEILALEASSSVARAKCVQPRTGEGKGELPAGTTRLLLVPTLEGVLQPSPRQLEVPAPLAEAVRDYLDERRLLGTALQIAAPGYVWVSVQVRIKVRERLDAHIVRARVEEAIYRFLHPLQGGRDGSGWPFGRPLYIADIYAVVHDIPGVEFISEAKIFPIEARTGKIGEPASFIPVPEGGLVASYRHLVVAED